MPQFKNYDPSLVIVSFRGIDIAGFMDSTFVESERDEASFTKHTGATGDVTRTRNRNKGGKVTITLIQTAASNDFLAAMQALDEATGLGYGRIQVKDLSGTMQFSALQAWVEKSPKIERAKESGSVVWVFDCASLETFAGGNIV